MATTGTIRLATPAPQNLQLVDTGTEEFFNPTHDPKSGRFGAGRVGGGAAGGASLQEKLDTATRRRVLAGGNSGAGVELLSGPKGKVVLKTKVPERDVDAEYLTSKIAKALGAPVPRVQRVDKNTLAMDYVDGRVGGTFSRGDKARIITIIGKKDRERVVRLKGARELGMLDLATNNFDRHGANIIVRPSGKSVVGIDHTLTFQPQKPPVSSRAFENHWKPGFTKSDYDDARKKIAPLRPEFQQLGHEDWFDQADQRLAKRGTRTETSNTGSIELVPSATEEFFNPTHDPKSGRFGERRGSDDGALAGKAPLQGDNVSKEDLAQARSSKLKKIAVGVGVAVVVTGLVVAGVKVNQNTVGGQFIRQGDQPGTYKIKSKNGSPIELIDHDGLAAGRRKTLLRHTKDIHDLHPLPDKQGIKISAKMHHDIRPDAEAFTSAGEPRTIFVNTAPFFDHKGRAADLAGSGNAGKSFFMPGYYGGEQAEHKHMIYHEYGHVVDNDAAITNQPKQDKRIVGAYNNVTHVIDGQHVANNDLSGYGVKKPQEAFAESFAEFYTSGGKTTNKAARLYADEFDWTVN